VQTMRGKGVPAVTREEMIEEILLLHKVRGILRRNLNATRDFCWAARLAGSMVDPADVLDIIGWPMSAEGHERGLGK
jgi:hypothetical protein